jgi:3-oxoacyl-(acyl-carrier-protein) synthase
MVLGEGAAVYVLEELNRALQRGAHVYAEVVGFSSRSEGGYGARIDAAELALSDAIDAAFREAEIPKSDLDYIASHGNSLPDYDLVETRAFKRTLGRHAYNVPVSSIKSMIGHALAAGSAFQVCSACLTIQNQIIPPTINLDIRDPECDLDYVPHRARTARVRHALLNAHAMGGSHSVLLLARPNR